MENMDRGRHGIEILCRRGSIWLQCQNRNPRISDRAILRASSSETKTRNPHLSADRQLSPVLLLQVPLLHQVQTTNHPSPLATVRSSRNLRREWTVSRLSPIMLDYPHSVQNHGIK